MQLNKFFICLMLSLSALVEGQDLAPKDTFRIDEVVISVKKTPVNYSALKTETLDSALISINKYVSLGEFLAGYSAFYIKSYGPGGTSSPSLRGTGAGHTQITWNGVNITNTMLGQSDLSIIGTGISDNVQILYGAASMPLTTGGIGGAINIVTNPEWEKRTSVSISPGLASFGQYFADAVVKTGGKNFQSVTKLIYKSSENDFPYINTVSGSEPVEEIRQNNQFSQQGFTQDLFYRKGSNIFSLRAWYQSAERNLPGSILISPSDNIEKQSDYSFRSMFSLNHSDTRKNIFAIASFLSDKLNYSNPDASVDSRNLSSSLVFKGGIEFYPGELTGINFNLNEEVNFVNSNNYQGKKSRALTTLSASATREIAEKSTLTLLLKQIVCGSRLLVPDFSGAIRYHIPGSEDLFVRSVISRSSKIATMNDLYWYPGGNPELENEYAYQFEAGSDLRYKLSAQVEVEMDVSLFLNKIHDMVQWFPGQYSYWQPVNIKHVNASGLETSANFHFKAENTTWSLKALYSYTASEEVTSQGRSGYQLIYTPENQACLSVLMNSGKFSVIYSNKFTGVRYTSADNSRYLPSYLTGSLDGGFMTKVLRSLLSINIGIDNIYNTNYESVAFYPMPGRSYHCRILIQL